MSTQDARTGVSSALSVVRAGRHPQDPPTKGRPPAQALASPAAPSTAAREPSHARLRLDEPLVPQAAGSHAGGVQSKATRTKKAHDLGVGVPALVAPAPRHPVGLLGLASLG